MRQRLHEHMLTLEMLPCAFADLAANGQVQKTKKIHMIDYETCTADDGSVRSTLCRDARA